MVAQFERSGVGEIDTVIGAVLHQESTEPALLDLTGELIDHRTLHRTIDRLARQLREMGLGPTDRIAIVLDNGPEMVLTLLAVMAVGCAAPLNPRYRAEEFRFYFEDLGIAALITSGSRPTAAHDAAPDDVLSIEVDGSGFHAALVGSPTATPGNRTPDSEDHALVLHTSGTTGRPKRVVLRQRQLAASARNIAAHLQLSDCDRSLCIMPLFHVHGIMAGLLAPLAAGGSVVCAPPFDAFQFGRWLDEFEPSYYSAVPTMHQMILSRSRPQARSSLRFIRSSSAALPQAVRNSLAEAFGVPVVEAYGMTEAAHQMACTPLSPAVAKPGSVGVSTGVEMAVLDRNGKRLAAGERGELAVRGMTVINGYEDNPEANAEAFTDGWFRTGDQGVIDADGYIFLTGRLKELINRGGEKVSPLEIEECLLGHDAVVEAVAYPIPHPVLGDEVGACVVLADGHDATEQDLRSHLKSQVARFKMPRRVLIVDEIPKGPTGKLQRIGMHARLQS